MKTFSPAPWESKSPYKKGISIWDADNKLVVALVHGEDLHNRICNAQLIEQAPNILKCLESALNDLEYLKTLALNGMPGEFTIGMCRRMDDYDNAIKKAKGTGDFYKLSGA